MRALTRFQLTTEVGQVPENIKVNSKKYYIPKTDGKGDITSLLRVEDIVTDTNLKKNFVIGLEFKLVEDERLSIDANSLK